ncbi:site-2 protease family protein [Myxosarcina sp. GI1]|uniref:site-2 protease family protein n=1 Tax=Myxosarcina sp. GI1 TaxID=1541065 RepID=UPI000565E622|nr:site-2 protease family protein [Myxosarcina sp. GI1]
MFNESQSPLVFFLIAVVFVILLWGYNRAKEYGRLGILGWLQSVVLTAPWLLFFSLFALGIYINIVGILFLFIASVAVYIWLGRKLRAAGQEEFLKEKAAARIKAEAIKEAESSESTDSGTDLMLSALTPIPEDDIAKLKEIFSIDTFFATETILEGNGAIFRGNLRNDPETAHSMMSEKLEKLFGEKYRLFLVNNPNQKPVVVILPSSNDPQPTTLAQKNLALVLFIATVVTSLEAASLLLGFDLFSDFSRYGETIPLGIGLWSVLIAHEIGHRVLAKRNNIRLSIPFFIPTWQIGSFGAITRFESLLPNRSTLFDIALAGPAVGGIVSLILLMLGLVLSHSGSLFQLPTEFFRSSILVGALAKTVLGSSLEAAIVDIHPLVIVGWLGLVITALNLLPAGKLDGGRIVHAIYGRKIARRTTVATLIVLGIVSLFNPTNPIPLYWAILILFLQRDLERPVMNELTEPNDTRAAWGLLALFLMLATLIPLSSTLALRLGIGG